MKLERKRFEKWRQRLVCAGQRSRLVFIDELSVSNALVRQYGWGPQGERIKDYEPLSSWKTYSLIAAIRSTGWCGSLLVPGAVNGDIFITYLEQCLIPTLRRGDIVVLDNVRFHHNASVADVLSEAGIGLHYLPPYSPDFNPIENAFSALKAHLRRLAKRTFYSLATAIGDLQEATTRQTCYNYLAACRYLNV